LRDEAASEPRFSRTCAESTVQHSSSGGSEALAVGSAAAIVGGQQVCGELDGAGGLGRRSSGAHGHRWEQCFQCGQE